MCSDLTQILAQGSWIFLLYTALLVGLTSTIRLILSIKKSLIYGQGFLF